MLCLVSYTNLTHWGRVTHICVSKLIIIGGSDNGLSPGRRQTIIRTNAEILEIRPLGTNVSEISIEILLFSFKKMRLKVSSAKRRPFFLGLNVLIHARSSKSDLWNYNPILIICCNFLYWTIWRYWGYYMKCAWSILSWDIQELFQSE